MVGGHQPPLNVDVHQRSRNQIDIHLGNDCKLSSSGIPTRNLRSLLGRKPHTVDERELQHRRNPGMMIPLSTPTMVSHGFKVVRSRISSIHCNFLHGTLRAFPMQGKPLKADAAPWNASSPPLQSVGAFLFLQAAGF